MNKMTSISVLMVLRTTMASLLASTGKQDNSISELLYKLMDKADKYEIMKCSGANFKEIQNSAEN